MRKAKSSDKQLELKNISNPNIIGVKGAQLQPLRPGTAKVFTQMGQNHSEEFQSAYKENQYICLLSQGEAGVTAPSQKIKDPGTVAEDSGRVK
ncbi:hypothetical protein NST38_31360 [Paenibacillus sp. FSL H8-0104]|uniref:hypothetical protein n=1 Tax=Paenibacillus sp. FSL H8-0104 TaxID=2954509 RepID=UPI0030FDDF7B